MIAVGSKNGDLEPTFAVVENGPYRLRLMRVSETFVRLCDSNIIEFNVTKNYAMMAVNLHHIICFDILGICVVNLYEFFYICYGNNKLTPFQLCRVISINR